jgi:hypothetical protein
MPTPYAGPVVFPETARKWRGREVLAGHFLTADGPIALFVLDSVGAPCRLNVNVPLLAALEPDEVAVKNYSENVGTLDALVSAGIVAPPHRHFQDVDGGSHVVFPVCRLLVTPREYVR